MRPICTFRRSFGLCFLSLGSLILLAALVSGGEANKKGEKDPAGEQTAKRNAKEAARMVEAIANRNKPPKIVKRQKVKPSDLPLYPKNYDWKEEDRVRNALDALTQDTSIELWEALVQKANDRRYCIASYSFSSDDVEMWSVGGICYMLAYDCLCDVFMKHLPSYPPHGSPIQMRDEIEDFPDWRKQRKDKALYQLQIEVCEIALRELPKLDADLMSAKDKAKARQKILAEIAELRRSKKPFVESGATPRPYPRRIAERIRQADEKGALEQLDFRLNK